MARKLDSLESLHELKKLRLLLGWSQLELASRIGISQATICQIEAGYRSIPTELRKTLDDLKEKHGVRETESGS